MTVARWGAERFGRERASLWATGRIPDRCYYLGTAHSDGLDSRYADIGFVCRARIIGTGDAIL